MTISVDPITKIITVPQSDLTFVSGTLYVLDTDWLRLQLKAWEASVEGMPFDDTHTHNTTVTVAGTTYFRTIEIINGYSLTLQNTGVFYSVRLEGSNNNFFDAENGIFNPHAYVGIIPTNSAGGQIIETGVSGLTAEESTKLNQTFTNTDILRKLQINKLVTDPDTGILTIYDDDDVTPLYSGNIYEDALATQLYRSQGLERRERLT